MPVKKRFHMGKNISKQRAFSLYLEILEILVTPPTSSPYQNLVDVHMECTLSKILI